MTKPYSNKGKWYLTCAVFFSSISVSCGEGNGCSRQQRAIGLRSKTQQYRSVSFPCSPVAWEWGYTSWPSLLLGSGRSSVHLELRDRKRGISSVPCLSRAHKRAACESLTQDLEERMVLAQALSEGCHPTTLTTLTRSPLRGKHIKNTLRRNQTRQDSLSLYYR